MFIEYNNKLVDQQQHQRRGVSVILTQEKCYASKSETVRIVKNAAQVKKLPRELPPHTFSGKGGRDRYPRQRQKSLPQPTE